MKGQDKMTTSKRYEFRAIWSGLSAWRTSKGWCVERWTYSEDLLSKARFLIPCEVAGVVTEPLENEDIRRLWELREKGRCLRKKSPIGDISASSQEYARLIREVQKERIR